jgi:prophage antirepressor-like protein
VDGVTQLDIFAAAEPGTELAVFTFAETGQEIQTVVIDGSVWLVAPPIARTLGHRDAADMLRSLDADEKGTHVVRTPGGDQRVSIISEPGLWRAITVRRKSAVKDRGMRDQIDRFQRWVFHEVIPAAIRGEVVPQPREPERLSRSELARRWYEAELEVERTALERDEAREQLAIAAPKASAWDVLASTDGDMSVRRAAFVLNRDPNISTGQNRLFDWMRDNGWVDKRNTPYQSHEKHVRLRIYTNDGHTKHQVRVTAPGLELLHRRLGGVERLTNLMLVEPSDPPAIPRQRQPGAT